MNQLKIDLYGQNCYQRVAQQQTNRKSFFNIYNYQNDSNSDFGVIANDDFMKRMVFPVGERTSNAKGYTDAVSKLGGPDEIGTRLYWDTGGSNF